MSDPRVIPSSAGETSVGGIVHGEAMTVDLPRLTRLLQEAPLDAVDVQKMPPPFEALAQLVYVEDGALLASHLSPEEAESLCALVNAAPALLAAYQREQAERR